MVDWAPHNRVALTQQLSVLSAASLHEETCYRRSVAVLRTLVQKLRHDDTVTHVYRRQLLHANIIGTSLVPLLLHEEPPYQVQDLALSLLDMLSTPEENLRPSQTALSGLSPEVSIQLSLGLRSLKEELCSPLAARAVLTPLRGVLARQPAGAMRGRDAECVSTTLSLLRNLLHGPLSADAAEVARYRNLLWVLLSAELGPALNQLLQSPSLSLWCVPVVELMAQLYKMYTSSHLHKTLQNWLNPIPSDSSEDDESNTSPPDLGVDPRLEEAGAAAAWAGVRTGWPGPGQVSRGGAPLLPPLPPTPLEAANSVTTSATAKSLKRKLTTVRAQERQAEPNSSTSSSDEGRNVKRTAKSCHHKPYRAPKSKPPPPQQWCGPAPPLPPPQPPPETPLEPCMRLLRSTRSRAHKILSLVTRDPSQGDVDTVLVEFTIQFLLTGWAPLVKALMTSLADKTDKSHLFWIIVYFMKPCTELRISYTNIRSLVCPELLMLLTYEATRLVGIGASHPTSTLERFHCQRQLHMLTNAIREILGGMEVIKSYSSEEHSMLIQKTQCQVGSLRQFRELLVLLIGQCRLDPASLPYLRDLVLTNHLLISTQESVNSDFPLLTHIALFAEPTIIRRYTSLLKLYATNPPVLNDALFTVLHHVIGDANHIELLFQPAVLKTFSEILGSDLPLLQDWLDLIEYTIHRFIERQHEHCVRSALQTDTAAELASTLGGPTSRQDPSVGQSVQSLAPSASGRAEALVSICEQLELETGGPVSPGWALDKLLMLRLLPPAQYVELCGLLGITDGETPSELDAARPDWDLDLTEPSACRQVLEHPSVEFLIDCVRREAGVGAASLRWLQSELLEVCAARLSARLPEPVALHSSRHGRACPLVPLTRQQVRAVNSPLFLRLLRSLRLQPPTPDYVYPLVPTSLPSAYLFAAAQRVAPLDTASLKFDPAELSRPEAAPAAVTPPAAESDDGMTSVPTGDLLPPPPPPPPPPMAPIRSSNWMAMISRQKAGLSLGLPRYWDASWNRERIGVFRQHSHQWRSGDTGICFERRPTSAVQRRRQHGRGRPVRPRGVRPLGAPPSPRATARARRLARLAAAWWEAAVGRPAGA